MPTPIVKSKPFLKPFWQLQLCPQKSALPESSAPAMSHDSFVLRAASISLVFILPRLFVTGGFWFFQTGMCPQVHLHTWEMLKFITDTNRHKNPTTIL